MIFSLQVKYVDHMENDQVKECWHQNVTQCHDTYITEFLPSQEQKCEETFWKSCKIDFKEVPFNYSLKQCHTPLVKVNICYTMSDETKIFKISWKSETKTPNNFNLCEMNENKNTIFLVSLRF